MVDLIDVMAAEVWPDDPAQARQVAVETRAALFPPDLPRPTCDACEDFTCEGCPEENTDG